MEVFLSKDRSWRSTSPRGRWRLHLPRPRPRRPHQRPLRRCRCRRRQVHDLRLLELLLCPRLQEADGSAEFLKHSSLAAKLSDRSQFVF